MICFRKEVNKTKGIRTNTPTTMNENINSNMTPIIMEEAYWNNSQFSVAKFYGGITFKQGDVRRSLKIVNKHGITIEELSDPYSKYYVEDGMAIQPGEPADLVDADFIGYYKALGREKFISIMKCNRTTPRERLKRTFEEALGKLMVGTTKKEP